MTRSIQTTSKMALSSLLLSTALAACTVSPDYSTPKTELALGRPYTVKFRPVGVRFLVETRSALVS